MFKDNCNKIQYNALCFNIKPIYTEKRFRLYVKQHFSYPPVNQSVAIFYSTDGLYTKQIYLTVFTSIAAKSYCVLLKGGPNKF